MTNVHLIFIHSYWGKEITEEIARQLITTGKTDIFHDFHNKKGVPFSAYLTIENRNRYSFFSLNRSIRNYRVLCVVEKLKFY